MTDDATIPIKVVLRLFAYRDAGREARATFRQIREASRKGDAVTAMGLEKRREEKRYALDRTLRELDESVREWADAT